MAIVGDRPAEISLIRVADAGVMDRSAAGGGGRTIWTIAPVGGGTRPLPPSLQYGVAPPGFTATRAIGLAPGRYILEIVSGGVSSISYFQVKNDGSIS